MKKIIAFFFFFIFTLSSYTQTPNTGKIIALVKNEANKPLISASVELLKGNDSLLAKSAITDKNGEAEFEHLSFGSYLVKVSAVDQMPEYSDLLAISSNNPSIQVSLKVIKKISALKEVVLEGRKPFIQKLSDRIVVNVDNSIIGAGSSVMDVLERSPGINIDQNNTISLRGKQGVIIMVDGKIMPLTGDDLANYLKGLPSAAIDRIDIITNPSAKYDAAGNSGIVDIHMKKDQHLGKNGTFTTGYGQGIYPKATAGTTFNYRNKAVNVFGNYNYAYRKGLNHLIIDRNFYTNQVFDGEDKKDNYTTFPSDFHIARLGADFFSGKKTIVGFVLNSNFSDYQTLNNNHSTVINNMKQPSYTFQTHENSKAGNKNTVANLHFKHSFDSSGTELTADVDYGRYNSNAFTNNSTQYHHLDGSTLQQDYILLGSQYGTLTLKTAKTDYTRPYKNGAKWETGLKTSYVASDNDAKFFDASSGTPKNDTTKTNHFLYQEYNNAAYINFSKENKKFNFQLGLRGELTNLKTYQVKGMIHFDSSYFQLFPSAFFNYKITPDQTLGISLSRRIDRPNYNLLNPFLFLIDVSTYNTGNIALLPQLTWTSELNYTMKNINFSLSYSYIKDVQNIAIVKFRDVFPNSHFADSNITVEIPVNLDASEYFGLSVSAPLAPSSWWTIVTNTDLYYNRFRGNLGGSYLNMGSPSIDIKMNNTFLFKKGWTAELNVLFNSGGRYGYMVSRHQWDLSPGLQKTILATKGTLRINITDIFYTNLPNGVITYPGKYIERWHAARESRVGTLTFTYRFGQNAVQNPGRRATGSEEERKRAQ